jgi:hypothetical protein
MKKIILFVSIALTLSCEVQAQKYNYGAALVEVLVKLEGQITVSELDSIVTFSSMVNGKENIASYKFIKNANNVIYFTDGVKTNNLLVYKEKGKKKGFDYDTVIILTMDGYASKGIYYCKEE